MATAIEKIDKIENVHDDGTSTKLSDQTSSTTREQDDSGKCLSKKIVMECEEKKIIK